MKKNLLLCSSFLITHCALYAQAPQWQWAAYPGCTDYSESHAVAADGFGNVYVTGWYINTALTFGSVTLPYTGDGDIFIVKYDSAGNSVWARGIGSTGFDEPRSVAVDGNGNLYVTGLYDSPSLTFGATTLTNAGTLDMFIVKYDSAGNVLWATGAGGADREFAEGTAVDFSGNVYVSGSFESATLSFGSTTLTNAGPPTEDIYIVKYDSSGNVLWARSGGGTGLDWATCVTTDAFGNAFIAGPFYSPSITFNTITLPNPMAAEEMFITKYDSSGNVVWVQLVVGNSFFNEMYSMATDAFGNIFVTGATNSDTVVFGSAVATNSLPGYFDALLAKYDSGGTVIWAKKIGGYGTEYGYSVGTDASGDVYLTGHFDSDTIAFDTMTFVFINPNFYSDLFLVKYDAGGNAVWAKSNGGIDQPASYGYAQQGITVDAAGNICTVGCFNNDSLVFDSDTLLLGAASTNMFIAKLNDAPLCSAAFTLFPDSSTQHLYWAINQATGTPPLSYHWDWGDNTYDTVPYPSHTYAVGGFYPICLTITDSTGCSNTVCHSYLLQLAPDSPQASNTMVYVNVVSTWPVGVEENQQLPVVLAYPNPVIDEFTIYSLRFTISEIEIYNMLGEKIFFQPETNNQKPVTVNVSNFRPGIYFVKVKGEGQGRMAKFVKQ